MQPCHHDTGEVITFVRASGSNSGEPATCIFVVGTSIRVNTSAFLATAHAKMTDHHVGIREVLADSEEFHYLFYLIFGLNRRIIFSVMKKQRKR